MYNTISNTIILFDYFIYKIIPNISVTNYIYI